VNLTQDEESKVSTLTDENKPHRPNEKYKLSRNNDSFNPEEEKLTFHYNREHRLAKAPQEVKDLYAKQKKVNRFNLLQPLVADKPRATLFISILVLCAVIFMLSLLGYFDKSYSLDGNKIEISGTAFEGTAIVVLRKTIKSKTAYSGAVDIAVSVPVQRDEDMPLYYHRVFFTLAHEEEYRFAVPFDSPELLIVLQTEKSTLQAKFKPE